jgi:hypothetical protein
MVNGCITLKGRPLVEGFFGQVRHNAAFLSVMDHF